MLLEKVLQTQMPETEAVMSEDRNFCRANLGFAYVGKRRALLPMQSVIAEFHCRTGLPEAQEVIGVATSRHFERVLIAAQPEVASVRVILSR